MLSMEFSQLIEQCRQGSADALGELTMHTSEDEKQRSF